MDTQLKKKAKEIIKNISYISLATVNENGDPWNTPLVTVFDKKYQFYWRSAKDAIHSQNIRANNKVFIIIYNTQALEWDTRQAIYIQAKAYELDTEDEIHHILPLLDKKSGATFGKAAQYLHNFPRRVYKATPEKVWINVDGLVNGVFVDKRIEINLF